jgi:hypothetical protein
MQMTLLRKVSVGFAAGVFAQSVHTKKHPGGKKNSHFVIPAGLLGRNPVF